jgi:uncharacterized protein HemX
VKYALAIAVAAVLGLAIYSWALTRAVQTAKPAAETPAETKAKAKAEAKREAIELRDTKDREALEDATMEELLDLVRARATGELRDD